MKGSPGGLARIDAIFHGNGYTKTFTASPLVFGAFPSLHAGNSTLEALFLSHFFPRFRAFYWTYVAVLYWATMHLSHHYMIDLVAGGSLAVGSFYFFLSRHPEMQEIEFVREGMESEGTKIFDHEDDDGGEEETVPDSARPLLQRGGGVSIVDEEMEMEGHQV